MNQSNQKIIAVAAGGTAGHIIPAMTIAQQLLNKGYKVVFIGTHHAQKYLDMFPDLRRHWNFSLGCIDLKPMPSILNKILGIPYILYSIARIARILSTKKVKLVVGFGGYVSLPTIIAATILFKKAILHEQNAHMGLANRIGLWFCKVGMLGFPETFGTPFLLRSKLLFTGTPVRSTIKDLHYQNVIPIINYGAFFKIYDKINIVIIGGSQGATAFKNFIPQAICLLNRDLKVKLRIFHQCPEEDVLPTQKIYNDGLLYADVRSFFYNVAELMGSAHVLISRSGAGIISEILTLGTPSILIPFPAAKDNHQLKNANYLQKHGAAILLEQQSITPQRLCNLLSHLFTTEDELATISTATKSLAQLNADMKILKIIDNILNVDSNITPEEKIDMSRLVNNSVGIS